VTGWKIVFDIRDGQKFSVSTMSRRHPQPPCLLYKTPSPGTK